MMARTCKHIPARTLPGQTRSALPAKTQEGSVKCAMGGLATLRIGSVNVGTMRGRDGEVVEVATRRHLDFCCLQKNGWRGECARKIGGYKFLWMGCGKGIHGVELLVADRWIDFCQDEQ